MQAFSLCSTCFPLIFCIIIHVDGRASLIDVYWSKIRILDTLWRLYYKLQGWNTVLQTTPRFCVAHLSSSTECAQDDRIRGVPTWSNKEINLWLSGLSTIFNLPHRLVFSESKICFPHEVWTVLKHMWATILKLFLNLFIFMFHFWSLCPIPVIRYNHLETNHQNNAEIKLHIVCLPSKLEWFDADFETWRIYLFGWYLIL